MLYGGEGNDHLSGGFNTPNMYGGAGNDTLSLGHFNSPTGLDSQAALDGGPGFDTLDFFAADAVTLSANDSISGIERVTMSGPGDTLALDVDGVLGASNETDTLIVDKSRDFDGGLIIARGGWEMAGTHEIDGAPFNEWHAGGATLLVNPSIVFDPPDDMAAPSEPAVAAGRGPVIDGTSGADILTGSSSADVIFGRGGDDTIQGGDGNDIVFGGPGNDTLRGGNGDDQLFGGAGNDTITDQGQGGNDLISGGAGDDVLIGGLRPGGGTLTFFGGDGNDQIFVGEPEVRNAGSSPALAYGGNGDDTILGENQSETFFGGDGNDRIDGFEGNDLIFGGRGDDTLSAGTADTALGQSTLYGGDGNDRLSGGFTTPAMHGGAGDDVLSLGHFDPVPLPGAPLTDFTLVFDGGPGFDTLEIGRADGLTLSGDDHVEGIERIAINRGQTLTLDPDGVLGASNETDTLIVDQTGTAQGHVVAHGPWQLAGTHDIDGIAFNEWHSGAATLLVNPTIDFDPL
jgi:Ca2+-binding RTX toxin-like protein